MTSNPVVCFILKGKEHMSQEAPDSRGGAAEASFTVSQAHSSQHTPCSRCCPWKDYTEDLLPGAPLWVRVSGGGVACGIIYVACAHVLKPEVNSSCCHLTF